MGEKESQPFSTFGRKLQSLRTKARESLLEVSGAVEIDVRTLESIESGKELPDEDVLMLLISHFEIKDGDAVKLWELAGYSKLGEKDPLLNDEQLLKQIMMVIPMDNRIIFSDTAHINAQKTGVVINFAQSGGSVQPQTVSRVGMSAEQAQILLEQLQESLHKLNAPRVIRALPAPKNQKSQTEKKK